MSFTAHSSPSSAEAALSLIRRCSAFPCLLYTSASFLKVPLYFFSHQSGHIAAALYSAGRLSYFERPFYAFHVSGGTTEALLVRPNAAQIFEKELLAQSLDLKAGQAIDRVGGMLGLPFPDVYKRQVYHPAIERQQR